MLMLESPDGALRRRLGGRLEGRLPMDADTVNATCNILLVAISIIGLLLMMSKD